MPRRLAEPDATGHTPVMTGDDLSWLANLEITDEPLSDDEQAEWDRWSRDQRRSADAAARVAARGTLDPAGCSASCTKHQAHVYVLCYGEPVSVRDTDIGRNSDPIDHYVGWTGRPPPVTRVREHGQMSAYCIAELLPGTGRDEARMKSTGRCAYCGASLRYWEQSPRGQRAYDEGRGPIGALGHFERSGRAF